MGIRPAHCYRKVKRPYTRKSKFKTKSYIKAVPVSKLIRFDMGDSTKKYAYKVDLISKDALQIRHNALESSRQVVNRRLYSKLGNNYFFKIRIYPHHILRENKMITGAGADRMQTGMQLAFGRPVGIAAQVRKNQPIFSIYVNEEDVNVAKDALSHAPARLPGHYGISVEKI